MAERNPETQPPKTEHTEETRQTHQMDDVDLHEDHDDDIPEKTFLGQTKGTWFIYWICLVASLANIFQGFDSGIYTIIIAEKTFLDRFNINGPRSGGECSST